MELLEAIEAHPSNYIVTFDLLGWTVRHCDSVSSFAISQEQAIQIVELIRADSFLKAFPNFKKMV